MHLILNPEVSSEARANVVSFRAALRLRFSGAAAKLAECQRRGTMKFHRCGGAAVMNLVIPLAFFAFGALILTLSPYRSLTCEHPLRPGANACAAVELSDVSLDQAECPLVPDIQCRIEAKILGFIPSHDQSLADIREFDARTDKVERYDSKTRSRRAAVESTLVFVTADGPDGMGQHANVFAESKYHSKLMAFARHPFAARIELVDNRKFPLVVGLVMISLGLIATFSAFRERG